MLGTMQNGRAQASIGSAMRQLQPSPAPCVVRPLRGALRVAEVAQEERLAQQKSALTDLLKQERVPIVPVDLAPPSVSPAAAAAAVDAEAAERRARRQREQLTYQASAIAATIGVTSIAILTTYLRFEWHLEEDGQMPWLELLACLSLVAGGVFGMEMYARFAHKVLWHDFEPGWALHKSHHMPRTGPFEANDIYAIINAVPAMALCLYGFFTPNILGGVCFGAGLGITLFGIMYMFIHDGLVHRRFPVGPIAELPYLKRVAVAHQLHHAGKYGGAPWGMFLGPQELESIPGASEELDRMVAELDFSKRK